MRRSGVAPQFDRGTLGGLHHPGYFSSLPTAPFPAATQFKKGNGRRSSPTLEQALRLHHHVAGTLLKLGTYLHQRTNGMIGSLSHLVRGGIEAILDGSEAITKATLEAIRLDHATEQANPQRSRSKAQARAAS
ncbi:MAG TPA: hypothetical protein VME46_22955 [Acidimicrobiales bacterium]|nr:hypothetical protein [Acidimicrobiales bacterium]